MTKKKWREKITEACIAAGTYRPFFEEVIETLADILNKRDGAQAQYKKSGSLPVIRHVNKGGNSNLEKNPVLLVVNDLNRDALAYWRELGLTPSAFKKLNEQAIIAKPEPEEQSALAKVLASLKDDD